MNASGDVAVHPGDFIVPEFHGALVLPAARAEAQERLEGRIMKPVEAAHKRTGLYPPNAENRAR